LTTKDFFIESLFFSKVPIIPGQYELGRIVHPHNYPYIGGEVSNYVDGDIGADIYSIDTTAVNYFEVTSYKSNKKEIEIRFSATYLKTKKYYTVTPDTLKFTDGYIKTRIND
jgi:hypothetical protein